MSTRTPSLTRAPHAPRRRKFNVAELTKMDQMGFFGEPDRAELLDGVVYLSRLDRMPRRQRFTVAEFAAMDEAGFFGDPTRAEIIDGAIYETSRIDPAHATATKRLLRWARRSISLEIDVDAGVPVSLGEGQSLLQPDLLIVRRREDDYVGIHPTPKDILLLVEVSRTSLKYDLGTKARAYALGGIAEYWVVNISARRIHVMRDPSESEFGTRFIAEVGALIAPLALPGAELAVGSLFGEDA